jgi:hypothetical protein
LAIPTFSRVTTGSLRTVTKLDYLTCIRVTYGLAPASAGNKSSKGGRTWRAATFLLRIGATNEAGERERI